MGKLPLKFELFPTRPHIAPPLDADGNQPPGLRHYSPPLDHVFQPVLEVDESYKIMMQH